MQWEQGLFWAEQSFGYLMASIFTSGLDWIVLLNNITIRNLR
jgi:hypothetical protein